MRVFYFLFFLLSNHFGEIKATALSITIMKTEMFYVLFEISNISVSFRVMCRLMFILYKLKFE